MPNRILHESICSSDTLAQVGAEVERFFFHLIAQADDFGRMDGRAAVLRSRLFQLGNVDDAEVARCLAAAAAVTPPLVQLYEVNGRPYVQIVEWEHRQRVRSHISKYPPPQDAATCGDLRRPAATRGDPPQDAATRRTLQQIGPENDNENESENENGNEEKISVSAPARGPSAKPERAAKAPRSPARQWPADFTLTPPREEVAAEAGARMPWEWNKFKDHHRAKGSRFVDWDAAWRLWLRHAVDFAERRRG